MATCTVQNILDDVRLHLSDTQVSGGEVFTNAYLLGQSGGGLFGEPYRSMFGKLTGASKRVQPYVYCVLPANTTVMIPSTYAIVDFSEPEMIEERPAPIAIAITSTDTSTPIKCTVASTASIGGVGAMLEGAVSGVAGTPAPWGNWFVTVIDGTTFSLNGSASDGVPGTGGAFYPSSDQPFTEVFSADLVGTLDGVPSAQLGNYLWSNGRLSFRGATQAVQLRITYYASGTAPTNPNYTIWIDNCRDFLSYATAANAADSKQWYSRGSILRNRAYGDPAHPDTTSLIDLFYISQVLADQRGPSRRQRPFRDRRYRWGSYLLG